MIVSVEDITSWYVLIEKVTGGAETEIVAVAHVGASVAVPATTYVAVNF